jgi:hypothetical protein
MLTTSPLQPPPAQNSQNSVQSFSGLFEVFELVDSAKMPTEDEIYRSSTQYRFWTFTPSKLASMRAETNKRAKDHVRAAIARRKRDASSDSSSTKDVKDVDFLTVDEEQELVDYYCSGLMDMIAAEKELAFQTPVIVSLQFLVASLF